MSCNPAIGFEGLSALSLALKNNSSLTVLSFNIPCNSIYMDKVKHEIIEYCERNDLAAASQKSIRPSHGAVITKTQATARLSLQERLAAVMQSKPRSESLSPSSVHQVMAPQKLTSFEQNNIFIDQTNEQVSLFEDIMSEAHKVDSSKEILMSLYHDYKNIHTTVSNKISEVEDSEQLMRLLEINDRIMSITAYDEFGLPIDIKESKNKTSDRLNSSHSEDVLATTSPLSPLSPFEIGDDDEDEDIILDQMLSDTAMDLMSLEELRHTKEIEEGTVFKKAKETKNE
ncbi:hypothetical protein BDF14DRAFT_649492 [Spinellus fusiger]|nr:hypothetical protein BDF14DRAFT_649492 [Spinellus fusiger]